MDTSKPVVILCSGPSARKISKLESAYVCTVNLCSVYADHTDFWVVNDANFLHYFPESKLKTISNLILPEYPHSVLPESYSPSNDFHYTKVVEHLPKSLSIHTFNLKKIGASSSGESAVLWLIHKGFKNFILLGMDPSGGRHEDIPGMIANSKRIVTKNCSTPQRYKEAFDVVVKKISKNSINACRLIIPEGGIVDDNLIQSIEFNGYSEVIL
tara:strand:+ start:4552 stop:5190 length:639 start_codon:yes stop_codon:yes gene_type:complete